MGRGLDWVTHRGPFQPRPCCDSVTYLLPRTSFPHSTFLPPRISPGFPCESTRLDLEKNPKGNRWGPRILTLSAFKLYVPSRPRSPRCSSAPPFPRTPPIPRDRAGRAAPRRGRPGAGRRGGRPGRCLWLRGGREGVSAVAVLFGPNPAEFPCRGAPRLRGRGWGDAACVREKSPGQGWW